ncbi:YlxR family protein [Tomitella biformata]|uniref:YlxR family protein n=1 Tax=Tomitella biformata TaxID=630403 RepID=UPI000A01DE57|nr:YlxR family protein [Tomitella biformata]
MAQHEGLAATDPAPGIPVRTCIGCRVRTLSSDLLRLVAVPGATSGFALAPDPARRLPGRGAWLHPNAECRKLAERRRAFGRALRVQGDLDLSALDSRIGAE